MTSVPDSSRAERLRVHLRRLLRFRPQRSRLALAGTTCVLTGAVALVPLRQWQRLGHGFAVVGWRWLPLALIVLGIAALGAAVVRRWRRGRSGRGSPIADRVPLLAHVAAVLLLATATAGLVGVGMWLALGRPHLPAATGAVPPGAPTGGVSPLSVPNTFDAMKIVLAVVAGIGGVVALTVAYRKQDHGEAAEHRENTKLFNERFGRASDQMGSDKAAVRLAGVYAMAGLADDWIEGRQTCIDVLCAYLRMPYTPPVDDTSTNTDTPASAVMSNRLIHRATKALARRRGTQPVPAAETEEEATRRQERQVRHTVIRIICDHLSLPTGHQRGWSGRQFDFTGAVFDGGGFSGAAFCGGSVNFYGATFTSDLINFSFTTFTDCEVTFSHATFSGADVDFYGAEFSGATVLFTGAKFSGGVLSFNHANFSSGRVAFSSAAFSGGAVYFVEATFSGGTIDFAGGAFCGGEISFTGATFAGGEVDLARPQSWDVPPQGLTGSEPGVRWPSAKHLAYINGTSP